MDSRLLTKNFLGITPHYFKQEFLPAFSEVSSSIIPREVVYNIAGTTVCLRFFNDILAARLMPAFAHLPQSLDTPDIVVNLLEGSIMPLVPPWSRTEFVRDAALTTASSEAFHGVYMSGEESLNFYDAESGAAYFWTYDAEALPGWVIGAPLRAILHWVLSVRRVQLVHAAAVGRNEEAVLLTAKSGSGKSTSALSCVLSGMTYLGDDYVAVALTQDELMVHTLYNSAKMTPHTQAMFPEYAGRVVTVPSTDDRKSVVYLSQIFPEQTALQSRVRAILIPSIDLDMEDSSLVPAGPREALRALAPTVFFQLPDTDHSLMSRLSTIVTSVPCYHLRLGSDVRGIPRVIDSLFSPARV